jgi:hypothetical protein
LSKRRRRQRPAAAKKNAKPARLGLSSGLVESGLVEQGPRDIFAKSRRKRVARLVLFARARQGKAMTQFTAFSNRARPFYAVALGAAVLLLLSACAGGPNYDATVQETSAAGVSQSPLLGDPGGASAWVKQGVTDQQQRQDYETCYAAAQAVKNRDQQVSQDINAGRIETDSGAKGPNFSAELRRYGDDQNYGLRLSKCMQDLGYSKS